jgi:hypothetical protein
LAGSRVLWSVRRLDLSQNHIGYQGREALEQMRLPQGARLNLRDNRPRRLPGF